MLTVLFFYESRLRCGGWRRGYTAVENKWVHVVNIWFKNKLSPLVIVVLPKILI